MLLSTIHLQTGGGCELQLRDLVALPPLAIHSHSPTSSNLLVCLFVCFFACLFTIKLPLPAIHSHSPMSLTASSEVFRFWSTNNLLILPSAGQPPTSDSNTQKCFCWIRLYSLLQPRSPSVLFFRNIHSQAGFAFVHEPVSLQTLKCACSDLITNLMVRKTPLSNFDE